MDFDQQNKGQELPVSDKLIKVEAAEFSYSKNELKVRGFSMDIDLFLLPEASLKTLRRKFLIETMEDGHFKFASYCEYQLFIDLCCSETSIFIISFNQVRNILKRKVKERERNLKDGIWLYIPVSSFEYNKKSKTFEFSANFFSLYSRSFVVEFKESEVIKEAEACFNKRRKTDTFLSKIRRIVRDILKSNDSITISPNFVFPKCKDDSFRVQVPAEDFKEHSPSSMISVRIFVEKKVTIHMVDPTDYGYCRENKNQISLQILSSKPEDANFDGAMDSIMAFYNAWDETFNQYWSNRPIVGTFYYRDGTKENVISKLYGFVTKEQEYERDSLKSVFASAIEGLESGKVVAVHNNFKSNSFSISHFKILQKITSYEQIPWIAFRKYVIERGIKEVYYFLDHNETASGANSFSEPTAFVTYMTIEHYGGQYRIILYPVNKKYSCYEFSVKKESVRLAQFYLWAYFSSLIKNKRYNFRLKPFFAKLGIVSFRSLDRFRLDFN